MILTSLPALQVVTFDKLRLSLSSHPSDQPPTARWPMALSVWTAFKIPACKGNSAEVSSSDLQAEVCDSHLPLAGGRDGGRCGSDGCHVLELFC